MRFAKMLLLALFCLVIAPVSAQTDAFEPTACPVEEMDLPPGIVDGVQIRCGLVTVPLYHGNPDAGTIKVGVAILPSTSSNPAPEPLILAQGGPGGSGFTAFPRLILGLQYFIGERDVIILEQRGTKFSQPDLVCEEGFTLTRETLDQDLAPEEAYALSEAASLACAERLKAEGIDFGAFNSIENAADIPVVAAALGYGDYHFYGVSYGTMLGQHLLNLNPQGLRSVILDANVPLSQNFLPITGASATRVFKRLFESCVADEICNTAYPDLERKYFEVFDRLQENPVMVDITDPQDDMVYSALVNGESMVSLTFTAMYSSSVAQTMPRYITQMYDGNFSWIERWGGEFVLRTDMASGFYSTVMCAEDADITEAEIPVADMYPQFADIFARDVLKFPELCAKLGVPALDSAIADMTSTSEVPVFVASGEFDPITPPAGGDIIAQSLPNAYHFVYMNGSHGALFSTACAAQMMTAFLADPTQAPDNSCMAELAMTYPVYHDDASGLFSVPVFDGWDNISTDAYTHFVNANINSDVYAVSVAGEDVNQAIIDVLAVIDPDFTDAPLQSQELDLLGETWINSLYLVGDRIRIVLSNVDSSNGVYVIFVIDTTQAALNDITSVLNTLLVGVEYTNP